jgi:YcxB-like protein
VTVRFALTRAEYAAVVRQVFRRSVAVWIVGLCGATLLVVGLAYGQVDAISIGGSFVAVLAVFLVVVPAFWWRRNPLLAGPRSYSFSEEGVTTETAVSKSTIEWSFFTTARRLGDFYVLRGPDANRVIVPRRAFSSAAEETDFCELVGRRVGSALSPS